VSGIEFRLVRRNSKFGLYESNAFKASELDLIFSVPFKVIASHA
jgi:hypothetical protein